MISPGLGRAFVYGSALVAVLGWLRSRAVLRHEAIIVVAVCIYFSIGTFDVPMPILDEWSPRLVIPADVWSVAGIGAISYLVGALVARRVPSRTHLPASSRVDANTRARILRWLGWTCLALLLSIYGLTALTGGTREQNSGYLVTGAMLAVPGILLVFAERSSAELRRNIALAGLTAALFLLTGYRTYTLLLLLAIAVLRYIDVQSARGRAVVVLTASVAAVFVGVAFGYWRFLREGNESGTQLVMTVLGDTDPSLLRAAASYVLVGFFREGTAILGFLIDRYPAMSPHTHGAALWGMLTSPLPGQQWDARAIISQAVYGQRETSLVSSIFGPWYLDFGLTGVAIGMALMGAILSRVETAALIGRSAIGRAAYAYGLVLFLLSVHSGLSDFGFVIMIPAAFLWVARPADGHATSEIRT